MTELIAFAVGVLVGIAVALPWRPLIRRRVCEVEDRRTLSRRLAELRAEMVATGGEG